MVVSSYHSVAFGSVKNVYKTLLDKELDDEGNFQ